MNEASPCHRTNNDNDNFLSECLNIDKKKNEKTNIKSNKFNNQFVTEQYTI